MKVKSRDAVAASAAANHDSSLDLDKPIFTLSVASEILEVHPRTLMMYKHRVAGKDNKEANVKEKTAFRDQGRSDPGDVHGRDGFVPGLRPRCAGDREAARSDRVSLRRLQGRLQAKPPLAVYLLDLRF